MLFDEYLCFCFPSMWIWKCQGGGKIEQLSKINNFPKRHARFFHQGQSRTSYLQNQNDWETPWFFSYTGNLIGRNFWKLQRLKFFFLVSKHHCFKNTSLITSVKTSILSFFLVERPRLVKPSIFLHWNPDTTNGRKMALVLISFVFHYRLFRKLLDFFHLESQLTKF